MDYIFFTQWMDDRPSWAEKNEEPSMTVPDQSMTIQEIIARFTRSGVMPVQVHSDSGGNTAQGPEFDPLDFDPDYWKAEAERLKAALDAEANKDSEESNKDTAAPTSE